MIHLHAFDRASELHRQLGLMKRSAYHSGPQHVTTPDGTRHIFMLLVSATDTQKLAGLELGRITWSGDFKPSLVQAAHLRLRS